MKTRVPLARTAAALCALTALTTLAQAQEQCDSVQIGKEMRTAFSLPERRLEPDMFTLEISEPDVCPDSEAVGLKVTACDREQAPHMLLLDKARGVVARAGPAASTAFVYVTVYCADADELEGDAAESPSVANRFSEPELLPSSSNQPSTVRSIFTLTKDSLPLPEVEPPSVRASSMDEYLPPVKLESRFSSLDQSSIPTILRSMLKKLLKERVTPSLGQVGIASRLTEKYEPSINPLLNDMGKAPPLSYTPDTSSLVKHLKALQPENRSRAWLQREANRFYDYDDAWILYDDGPQYISSDEPTDPIIREGEHIADSPPVCPKHPHHGNTGTHFPLLQEHPSPSSIKHISKNQNGCVPPIREEDPTLLAQWRKQLHPRPLLPKLLLLLQEQDHPAPIQRKCDSAHSIDDTEQWWARGPYQDNTDDGIPCQTDCPTDYSADYYTDDMTRGQFPHLAPAYLEEHAHVPQYPDAPERALDSFHHYGPNPHTERPLLKSTVRHSLSWVKSGHAVTPKPRMKLSHESAVGEQREQPWTFLSRLLLSHPTFRDSTHVIRIR